MRELSDKEIKAEEKFMEGLPRINIGALLLPPIWGPAHGFWVTILFYPAWLLADNLFYAVYVEPTVLSVVLAVCTFIVLLVITIAFSLVSQPIAAHRAEDKGKTREQYLKAEKIWAIVGVAGALLMLGIATWYNLDIRPFVVE